MNPDRDILAFLREHGIPFSLYRHRPVHTMEECLSLKEIDWDGAQMCKNILLCDRRQSVFFLFLSLHNRPFVTAQVSKMLGVSRLSFAPAEKLRELLGTDSGALSPLALIRDSEKRVHLATDAALAGPDDLIFHPGVNTASVRLRAADFFGRFLPATGHGNTVIDLGIIGQEG